MGGSEPRYICPEISDLPIAARMDETHAECTRSMEIEDLKRDNNREQLVGHDFVCFVNTLSVNIRLDKPAKIGSGGRGAHRQAELEFSGQGSATMRTVTARSHERWGGRAQKTYGMAQTGIKIQAFLIDALWIRCWHVSTLEGKNRPIPSLVGHGPASSLFSTLLSSSPGGRGPLKAAPRHYRPTLEAGFTRSRDLCTESSPLPLFYPPYPLLQLQ